MVQEITLYQAVRGDSQIPLKAPIYSERDTWLGQGFYFWEHHVENAHYWGRKHYSGRYHIYESSYRNTERGLDLVDNYEDRERLIALIQKLSNKVGQEVSLAEIIFIIMHKIYPGRVKYVRMDTGSFYPNRRCYLPVPNKTPLPWMFERRLVQVYFSEFPCLEIGLTQYRYYYPGSAQIG